MEMCQCVDALMCEYVDREIRMVTHKDLDIWKQGVNLVKDIYELTMEGNSSICSTPNSFYYFFK